MAEIASQRKGPEAMLWGLWFGRKADFSGDFPGSNLTMRENFGAKSFAQALISNGL
jgi:hypothetical protein